jgi:protein ImuB
MARREEPFRIPGLLMRFVVFVNLLRGLRDLMFACLYSPSSEHQADLERVARDFSPRVEVCADGVVFLDLSGLDRLIGSPRTIADELTRALPLDAQIAIAGSRVAAYLLARAAPRTIVEPGTEAGAVAPLPAAALSRLGAPADLVETLERWGIRTLGQFAALPAPALSARLGQAGLAWQRAARGEDTHGLVPTLPEERFENALDLDWPIEGIEPLAFVLGRLLDPLCSRLEARDRGVAALTLRLRAAVSREWNERRLELPAPMRDVRMLRTLICLDLEGRPPAGAIDRVAILIDATPGRICQFSLIARPALAPEQAATLMARLRALMGQDRCGTARLLDSHRPGAFAMGDFPPSSPVNLTNPANLANLVNPVLRRLRQPIPARVVVEAGRPVRVVTDRRGWPGGRVVWAAGPWRSSGEWWTPNSWNHQEWDVALADGATYRIYEDRLPSDSAPFDSAPFDSAQGKQGKQGRPVVPSGRGAWFIEAVLD